jgi:predicted nucleic acid-binding protein
MTTAVFVDSTTLLYPLDDQDRAKKNTCAEWLRTLRQRDRLILSLQVVNETYSVVCRKPAFAAVRPYIRAYLQDYIRWTKAPLSNETTQAAFALEDRYGVRFWDALVLASANAAGCGLFLSEDLNDGQTYGAVKVVNPFRHAPEDVLGAATRP